MAHDAQAPLEGLGQGARPVEVEQGAPQLAQGHHDLVAVALGHAPAHQVVAELGHHGQPHLVDVGERAVHEHADALPGLVVAGRRRAPEAVDVGTHGERLEPAVHQHGELPAQVHRVLVDGAAVGVLVAPGIGATVVRVGVALEAGLVAVVHAGHARRAHLHEGGQPQAPLGESALPLGEAVPAALVVGEGVLVGRAAKDGEQARAVVAAQQVEGGVEGVGRVVLLERRHALRHLLRGPGAADVVEQGLPERVVHGAVELGAAEVLAYLAVGQLVGGVLPHLAQEQGVGQHAVLGGLDAGDEGVVELVGHVQAPAAGAGAQPVGHHAVGAVDEVLPLGVGLVGVGQVVHAPPAGVGAVLLHEVPGAVGRVGRLPGPHGVVVAELVEVAGVHARVVEHAVEDHRDAHLGGLGAQAAEPGLVAQHGVHGQVVARVVAVVGLRLEDGVQVDGREPHVADAAQLLADALERAAVELPLGHAARVVALVRGRLVPVLHQGAGHAAHTLLGEGRLRALAPVGPALVAVGEDLVDHAALVPVGRHLAGPVHGDLERRGHVIVHLPHTAGAALAGAVVAHGAVGALEEEGVPDDAELLARDLTGEGEAAVVGGVDELHGQEGLTDAVDPRADGCLGSRVVPHVHGQRDGAALGGGAVWVSVPGAPAVVKGSHGFPLVLGVPPA